MRSMVKSLLSRLGIVVPLFPSADIGGSDLSRSRHRRTSAPCWAPP